MDQEGVPIATINTSSRGRRSSQGQRHSTFCRRKEEQSLKTLDG